MRIILSFAIAVVIAFGHAYAQELTIGFTSDAVSLDPHMTNDLYSAQVKKQIYDTLVIQNEELELEPGLAESWEQIDDTTWEFRLREGVAFHNGELLTASDVKFTLDRLRDPEIGAPAAFLVGFMESVEVVDELTVRINTEFPFAPILSHLAHTATSILNETAVTEAGEDYGTEVAVGTGAFSFVLWETASRIVVERNPDWWGGEPLPERVVFRPIPDHTVRSIELETGGVDIAYRVDPADHARLEADPNIVLAGVETLGTTYLGFNVEREPFDDVLVRQAINHALDVDTIVDVVFEGQGARAAGPLSPRVWGANLEMEPYEYDPERAMQLLEEAGYGDGFSATIRVAEQPPRIQIAEIAQAQLAELGVDIGLEVLEWGTYLAETAAGNHDMFILGWTTVTADADYGLYALFHSDNFGAAGNRTFYGNDRVDELLDIGRTSTDEQVRFEVYQEVQQIIRDEAPWLFLHFPVETDGLRTNVEGFVPHPAGHHRLFQVTKTD